MATGSRTRTARPAGRYRWAICALLFFVITINYIDRPVLGVLKPMIEDDLGWTEVDYGNIVSRSRRPTASACCASGGCSTGSARAGATRSPSGCGARRMFHARRRATCSPSCSRASRSAIGESAAYPGAVKAVAEWFPRRERALGVGILNAGRQRRRDDDADARAGAGRRAYGWQAAFIVTGAFGSWCWIAAWLLLYRQPREHPKVTPGRARLYRAGRRDATGKPLGWRRRCASARPGTSSAASSSPTRCGTCSCSGCPTSSSRRRADCFPRPTAASSTIGPALIGVYLLADVGSIAGGWVLEPLHQARLERQPRAQDHAVPRALCAVPLLFVLASRQPAGWWC